MANPSSVKHIAIVGAGLVGSLLAVYMRKRGHSVKVFERRPDLRKNILDGGRSINLVVTSRGIHALEKVGLWDKVKEQTVSVRGRMMHDLKGETTYQPYGRNDSECNYSISRTHLNQMLLHEAEIEGAQLHFECPILEMDIENSTLRFESGSEKFDHIFGTDGAGSVVRKQMMSALQKRGVEQVNTLEPLGAGYKELTLPAAGAGEYALDKNALHIWPRGHHMLMGLANLDGSFTMTLYLPEAGRDSFEEVKTADQAFQFFKEQYPDAVPLMPNLATEYSENPQGFLGTVRCAPWVFKDKVALLGDAAHAVVPFFGQGMNCGFEDITYLMTALDEFSEDWEKAFLTYFERQKPNADAIADMAIENFIEMRDRVADDKFLLRKKVERRLEQELPELYRTRYAMVTYTLVPYAEAKSKGIEQNKILDQLCANINDPSQLDIEAAKQLLL
ncbi:MAG: FAD-dependent monooxygenase [Pseudobdellovibrionaceae bacterium]|nr:FAD-dependent monooxygenase [Bdellovibrionales bacterium]USN48687.1 MAG: FAD-dependent monooxygenase [Pseudobdellovibrionaceae bacterium]